MEKGIIYDIKRFAIHDGPGIRTTVFLKGCPCDCWWCHNPESRSAKVFSYLKQVNIDGQVMQREQVIGKALLSDDLMLEIEKDTVFYSQSEGGVTFSGGEPLQQIDFLKEMLQKCKAKGIHTTLDTTLYCQDSTLQSIKPYVDLFMIDLKFVDPDLHRKYTGVSNRPILANIENLLNSGQRVWLRIPIIPGINTSEVSRMIAFLSKGNKPEQINLLPYHNIGKHKYTQFGISYRLDKVEEPSDELMQKLKSEFDNYFSKVEIGG